MPSAAVKLRQRLAGGGFVQREAQFRSQRPGLAVEPDGERVRSMVGG